MFFFNFFSIISTNNSLMTIFKDVCRIAMCLRCSIERTETRYLYSDESISQKSSFWQRGQQDG